MKMSVIGCGHLGATHAACMASLGHEVIGVDIDEGKVSLLNSGKGWFHEPDLDPMLAENIAAGRLRFTTDFAEAAEFAAVHFIGVATPGHPDGTYDMSQLRAVMSSLVPHLAGDCLIIGKSTVTPGTAASLQEMADGLLRPGQGRIEVAWNPEFLREGCAVEDTLRPDRIVVGAVSEAAAATIREIYQPQTDAGIPLVLTDLPTSELAKGAANAFLATKISFINAMADICAATGGDITALANSLGLDPRIGKAFLRAGLGYGGACLPKDVRGLGSFAAEVGARNAKALLGAVDAVNSARIGQTVDLVRGRRRRRGRQAGGGLGRIVQGGHRRRAGVGRAAGGGPAALAWRHGDGVRPNGQRQRAGGVPRARSTAGSAITAAAAAACDHRGGHRLAGASGRQTWRRWP